MAELQVAVAVAELPRHIQQLSCVSVSCRYFITGLIYTRLLFSSVSLPETYLNCRCRGQIAASKHVDRISVPFCVFFFYHVVVGGDRKNSEYTVINLET